MSSGGSAVTDALITRGREGTDSHTFSDPTLSSSPTTSKCYNASSSFSSSSSAHSTSPPLYLHDNVADPKGSSGKRKSAASPSSAGPASESKRKAPAAFHFLAGLVTGSLSAVLLQPADLLKTRVQQSRGMSVTGALKNILSQPDSVRQLWRGTLPSVIRTGFGSALYFAGLNAIRAGMAGNSKPVLGQTGGHDNNKSVGYRESRVSDSRSMADELGRVAELARTTAPALDSTIVVHVPPESTMPPTHTISSAPTSNSLSSSALPKLSNAANLLSGALARGGAGLVMMPITVLKVRYESSLYGSYGSTMGLVDAGRAILAREGIRGLYAGYGATLVRDAPYAGLYVLFYEQAKPVIGGMTARISGGGSSSSTETTSHANFVNFTSSVLAAATATAVTNPFDAIKTRIQLMPDRYRNMPQAARLMMARDGGDWGFRVFFDGLGLRMARKAMSSAVAWTIYEDLVRRAEGWYAEAERRG